MSFGMMATDELDQRPEFDFGRSEMEYKILIKWVTAIKSLPPCLSKKNIQKVLSLVPTKPKPEPEPILPSAQPEEFQSVSEPVDLSMLSTNVLGSSSGVKQEPDFDEHMTDREPTQGPRIPLSFSTQTFNNIISQIPDHPVLNIDCQSRDAIHDSLNLLFH